MKDRIKFLIFYILFWLSLFIIGRLIFLFYHYHQSFELGFGDWIGIILHGLKLDFSTVGYILLLPVLVLIFAAFFPDKVSYYIINTYTVIFISIIAVITITDAELYNYWGFRLDKTPLQYINTPKDMLASVKWHTIFLGMTFLIAFAFIVSFFYLKYISIFLLKTKPGKLKSAILFAVILPSLVIPIRGGFDTSPVNLSTAYFHENSFANHAAVNLLWNFGYSFTINSSKNSQFDYLEPELAKKITHNLYKENNKTNYLLKGNKPNIIIIILESFTAQLVEPLGGAKGVTPNFNELTRQGIFFTNFYANDSRSDKGIVAILSGYPSLGIVSVIRSPKKSQSLPFISKCLSAIGYNNSFYYGGDINFGNMNSYLYNGGFNSIISKSDYLKSEVLSSWGVPDHISFNRLFNDIDKSDGPFFKVYFSLSNHEPFDVPIKPVFKGTDSDSRMSNSSYYTDSCLGNFVSKLKASEYWDNTLLIILADHGHIFPGWAPAYSFRRYHIPMLWLGGVISKDTVITRHGSQVDIAETLLNQLQIPDKEFVFSKDLLSESSESFAFYAFKNGFGFITDSIRYVFDNDSRKVILKEGRINDTILNQGKALQQVYSMDYYNR